MALYVQASDEIGNTPLHTACKAGHHGIVALLLAAPGIDPSIVDVAGDAAFHKAALNESLLAFLIRLLTPEVVGSFCNARRSYPRG